jgi:dTDP-4-dehydrorhamnose reductase
MINNIKSRLIIFGSNGQLGWELTRTLQSLGNVVCINRDVINILEFNNISLLLSNIRPDVIINAAAYTDVEFAEKNYKEATALNTFLPGFLATEAKKYNALLVHFSTDAVFDGYSRIPYTENDKTAPLNFYAETKLLGEIEIQNESANFLIFRIAWLYSLRRKNFLLTIIRLCEKNNYINVVNDQWGSPTWARSVAEMTSQILYKYLNNLTGANSDNSIRKLYHMTSPDYTTWFDFACSIVNNSKNFINSDQIKINPISSDEFKSNVVRPSWSVLNSQLLYNDYKLELTSWKNQIELCINS